MITEIRLNVDWAIAIKCSFNGRNFVLINVYLPYECSDNECDFLSKLAHIDSFISELDTTSVFIVGDMNADVANDQSTFENHLAYFCIDNDYKLASQMFMPANSYTYISDAWHSTSWLDHCVCTDDACSSILEMSVMYNMCTSDHMPIQISIDFDAMPMLTNQTNDRLQGRVKWSDTSEADVIKYRHRSQSNLSNVNVRSEALLCKDPNCKNTDHTSQLDSFYNDIIRALNVSSEFLCKKRSKPRGFNVRPGWNEHVAELHTAAREAHLLWRDSGRPRQGPLMELRKSANARFKYALRYIKKQENAMRADSLAQKLQCNDYRKFWKEIKAMNNSKMPLPTNIESVTGGEKICELWQKHYHDLFNCIRSPSHPDSEVTYHNDMIITANNINDAIKNLECNKSCGMDNISSEHLKYASPVLLPLLAMCFSGFVMHGVLPDSLISILLVPVIKNKCGKISSKDNYRPIALASVVSKVLERVLLNKMEKYLFTNDSQFGFKKQHSTDMCIYVLKELIHKYNDLSSSVFVGFLDASKAFDRVNHYKLFSKLSGRGVPQFLVRLLVFWYSKQTMIVSWGNAVSQPFTVSNGVRQGGILSPFLFSVYMDDLSNRLKDCRTGCVLGNLIVNHLMYADDLVIFSPSTAGLQSLLNLCSEYGLQNDIKYNSTKSQVMIVRSKDDKGVSFPDFHLSGSKVSICDEYKYLGHYFTCDLKDDKDISRQRSKLYSQGNILARKFSMCSPDVKVTLFRAYCSPLYTPHLWCKYTKTSMNKLNVAFNDALRMLLRVPRFLSGSQMFSELHIPNCAAVIRNLMYKFIVRLDLSENHIIQLLVNPMCSSFRLTSHLRLHWHKSLLTVHID